MKCFLANFLLSQSGKLQRLKNRFFKPFCCSADESSSLECVIGGHVRAGMRLGQAGSKSPFLQALRAFPLAFLFAIFPVLTISAQPAEPEWLPLYYWQQQKFVNFGDYLSLKIVERIVDGPVRVHRRNPKKPEKKLLALGSLLTFALDGDVIWGTGINGKFLDKKEYRFSQLDIRAVRGPLTRQYLMENCQLESPEIYGDPALLLPLLFPEFKRKENPAFDYIVIYHYSETHLFPKEQPYIVYATDPWEEIIDKILDSKFVISTSLHGVVVAEAFGIPARLLRITENEAFFKFQDYYLGTQRPDFRCAYSIEEALQMGGEPPFVCDLEKLYRAFPFEFFPKKQN